ncbi:hypothetical protein FHR24_003088 [Wenyingzhuangia heitensis]|uniref:DUF2971 domain-containing protein n=1 Tax=Wenyingzhuangia heitensis TaxID=1487859 RepID=A0ABX0UCY9_9FLAO|nr:DUF2971 domain-containing protein [Wenyingzhuangia heitensis]NIJ46598.1 hypothetical protein [Wenyingzhuangia heitensis]
MIYHYTSIEILALILHNKKIRFNNLNQVNDRLESTKFEKLKLSNYIFVSCFTENKEENIALWNMYSNNMKGVRIGINKKPFKLKKVNQKTTKAKILVEGEKHLPFTIDECLNKDYFIFPSFIKHEEFFKKIEYLKTEELNKKFNELINIQQENISITTKNLAISKHERWGFEEESRFILLILPPIKDFNDVGDCIKNIGQNKQLPFSFFDIEIDDNCFENIEITLGPNCSDSDKNIVDSLISKYGIKKKSKESELKEIIRFK